MNKDNHTSLSVEDRFNLFLSQPAVDREFAKVKRPTVNVESLPTSIYYREPDTNQGKTGIKKMSSGSKRAKKDE